MVSNGSKRESSRREKLAFAAAVAQGPGQLVTFPVVYDVPLGTAPAFIAYSGAISRTAVKFDTAGIGLGKSPTSITIHYRIVGKPKGAIAIGIRKASDDSFQLIAEWPIEDFIDEPSGIHTVEVTGGNTYVMVANDKLSIEYPASATDRLEIATSTTQGNPSGFTPQQYTGTYANTTNPLAVTIKARQVV